MRCFLWGRALSSDNRERFKSRAAGGAACESSGMDSDGKKATRGWYKARQRELREIMWEWDPLGIMGVADDEYDCLIDPVLSALSRGIDAPADLKAVLGQELLHMGDLGYSGSLAERESQSAALEPIVQRIAAWWRSAPPPP
jgi:hypothetical protein